MTVFKFFVGLSAVVVAGSIALWSVQAREESKARTWMPKQYQICMDGATSGNDRLNCIIRFKENVGPAGIN